MQEGTDAAHLREQAKKCRRLADSINDPDAIAALRKLAADYEANAVKLSGSSLDGAPHQKMSPPNP